MRARHALAAGLIRAWLRFEVRELTTSVLTQALEFKARHGSSYWDSAIIADAHTLGCRELFSEDMEHGREAEGIIIIDPFR